MAQSVQIEIEKHAYLNLKASMEEKPNADDDVIRSVRYESLRFQRWFHKRHVFQVTQKMIMVARMGLTFWQDEK